MIVAFVHGQTLRLNASGVVADTINYLEAKFIFKTDDWNGLDKWAHFANSDGIAYDIRLTEDCIRKEDHLNLSAGMWKVYLHGNEFADGMVIQRITTDEAVLYVIPTGVLDGEPFPTVPPSAGEQIIASAQLAEAGAKESAGRAASSAFSAAQSAGDAAESEKAASESRDEAEKFRDETAQFRDEVDTSAKNALDEIASAGRAAVSAVENEGKDAVTAVRNARDTAVQTVETAGETQVREVAEAAEQHKSEAAASAQAAKSAADAAEQSKNQTEEAASGALTDIGQAAQNAKTDINTARESAVGAVQSAGKTGLTEISDAVSGAKTDIQTAAESALTAIGNAGTEEVREVQDAGETAVDDVAAVRDAVVRDVQDAGTEAVDAIEAAGQTKLDEIAAEKLGAVRYDIVQELTDAQRRQARDNTRSAGEIVESATGEVVAVDDAADAGLRGLCVYGKSVQDGTPSPDAPVEIVSVGGDGVAEVGLYGSNLFDYTNFPTNYKEGTVEHYNNGDGSFTAIGDGRTAHVANLPPLSWIILPAGKYKVGGSNVIYTVIAIREPTGTRYFNKNGTFTLEAARKVRLYIQAPAGFNGTDTIIPFLQIDSLNAAYEPYTAQTLPISTPDGLCGIPVTSTHASADAGNYTDDTGMQWQSDVVDFARGVRLQKIKKITLDGSENWQKGGGSVQYSVTKIETSGTVAEKAALCDYFPYADVRTATSATGVDVYTSDAFKSDVIALRTGITDVDGATDGVKGWLKNHPITVYYALATPIETPLTESELAAYKALHTNYPNTTIYADDNAGVAVDYVADTKRYIDKKFAELSAAIINN